MKTIKRNIIVLCLAIIGISSAFAQEQKKCSPWTMEQTILNYEIAYTRGCDVENNGHMIMEVTYFGNSVSIDSRTLSSTEVDIEKAIMKRATEGLSDEDADRIVTKIAPALKRGDLGSAKMDLIELILH